MALEEWRHWLEGVEQPFGFGFGRTARAWSMSGLPSVLTTGKLGGPFFVSSIVSTSPSHIALAHKMLNLMHCPACFTLILLTAPPPASYLLPVWWEQSPGELTRRLNKLTNSLIPDGCPQNQLFVPASLRSHVIYWAHTSRLTCHQRGDVPRP